MGEERNPNQPPDAVISSLLSFYGSQLTSHASMIVGFLVALFTLVQAKLYLPSPLYVFEIAAFAILSGIVYSILRLVWYGFLSSVLTNMSMRDYPEFELSRREVHLSDFGIVNSYVGD